jgi:hypothetical protein
MPAVSHQLIHYVKILANTPNLTVVSLRGMDPLKSTKAIELSLTRLQTFFFFPFEDNSQPQVRDNGKWRVL